MSITDPSAPDQRWIHTSHRKKRDEFVSKYVARGYRIVELGSSCPNDEQEWYFAKVEKQVYEHPAESPLRSSELLWTRRRGDRHKVTVILGLYGDEIEFLSKQALDHYDGYCNSLATPGPNAFICGWMRQKEWAEKDCMNPHVEVEVDSHKCDVLRKVLEPNSNNPEMQARLYMLFSDAWKHIKECEAELNK